MSSGFERARHALRTLSRNRRFATLAILSLGIAIALNTTMYSVLDAIVFPRVAMHKPERLYTLSFFGDYRRVIGIAIGLVLAFNTVGLLGPFLRSPEAVYDSWLYAIAAGALFLVIILASYLPARRAMRINPVEALRND